ncbi:MAG: DUF4136 domain-containing protein [Bacteroidota bacterium]|nr:DUF4136 domain-containing protein [Bacteroidota bacterium]
MNLKTTAGILAVLMVQACGTPYILSNADYEKSVDFTRYKTFSWIPQNANDSTTAQEEIIMNNTINYFSRELAARNMTLNNDNPDLLFQLQVAESKEQRSQRIRETIPTINPYYYNNRRYRAFSPYNRYYNLNPRSYFYRGPFNYSYNSYTYGYTTRVTNYTKSTLTLNVLDRKQNKFVYTATVEADLYDPSAMKRELHPAVHSLLDNYPVKASAQK